MNNRGYAQNLIIVLLLALVVLLYFYTGPTKDIVGMIVNTWDPVDIDDENKSITIQFADASKMAHKVVLGEDAESDEYQEYLVELEENKSKYASYIEV
jgi:hypothetical protein